MRKVTMRELRRFSRDAKSLSEKLAKEGPIRLTNHQHRALDRTLRALDIRNEYEIGDSLRRAFGVELNGPRSRHAS